MSKPKFTGLTMENLKINGEEKIKRGNIENGESGSGRQVGGSVVHSEDQKKDLVVMTGPLGSALSQALNIVFKKEEISDDLQNNDESDNSNYLNISKEESQFFEQEKENLFSNLLPNLVNTKEYGTGTVITDGEDARGMDKRNSKNTISNDYKAIVNDLIIKDETEDIDMDPGMIVYPIRERDFNSPVIMAPIEKQLKNREGIDGIKTLLYIIDSKDEARYDDNVLINRLHMPLETTRKPFISSTESYEGFRNTKVVRSFKSLLNSFKEIKRK